MGLVAFTPRHSLDGGALARVSVLGHNTWGMGTSAHILCKINTTHYPMQLDAKRWGCTAAVQLEGREQSIDYMGCRLCLELCAGPPQIALAYERATPVYCHTPAPSKIGTTGLPRS